MKIEEGIEEIKNEPGGLGLILVDAQESLLKGIQKKWKNWCHSHKEKIVNAICFYPTIYFFYSFIKSIFNVAFK